MVQLTLDEGAKGDRTAVLNLVDLAGSENVGRSRSNEDESRLKETRSINKSLLGLGKCITPFVHAECAAVIVPQLTAPASPG